MSSQHGLAAIAEAGGLDGGHFEAATQLVDHEGRKRFALHVLGNDEQRARKILCDAGGPQVR